MRCLYGRYRKNQIPFGTKRLDCLSSVKKCGLSENTIATILKRNSLPSVGTLESICNGFGITLSEFFAEGDLIEVSSDTKQLIEYWGGISPKQKQIILDLLKNMNQE